MVKQKTTKRKVTKTPKKESNWELFNKYSAIVFLFGCLVAGVLLGYFAKLL